MNSVRRALSKQYELFPPQFQKLPTRAEGRASIIADRQPRRFPTGWNRLALSDPDWREKHYANWQASRKALGLPYIIHDTLETA